jgi:hypothetical protein
VSLGIAVADELGIYLAIECAGVGIQMGSDRQVLDSKIIKIQDGIFALGTGWLINWLYVRNHYRAQYSIEGAAREITGLLKRSVELHPEDPWAYGRVCGYRGEEPVIFNVSANREKSNVFDCSEVRNPYEIQPIGLWELVTQSLKNIIYDWNLSKIEMIKFILEQVPERMDEIVHPVHCKVLLGPDYQPTRETLRDPIRRLAYSKFIQEGRPQGAHLRHWLEAKAELGFSDYPDI